MKTLKTLIGTFGLILYGVLIPVAFFTSNVWLLILSFICLAVGAYYVIIPVDRYYNQ